MRKLLRKNGQQEIAGFVLIVVVVVIALMVFLIISLKKEGKEVQNIEAENMLSSIMAYTTECSINLPNPATIEDLMLECEKGAICQNSNEETCEYLNKKITEIISSIVTTDQMINAYQFDAVIRSRGLTTGGEQIIKRIFSGNCTGVMYGAQKNVASGPKDIIINLKFCYNADLGVRQG